MVVILAAKCSPKSLASLVVALAGSPFEVITEATKQLRTTPTTHPLLVRYSKMPCSGSREGAQFGRARMGYVDALDKVTALLVAGNWQLQS
jgi:hypothetical protein